jgi:hypothetical protein
MMMKVFSLRVFFIRFQAKPNTKEERRESRGRYLKISFQKNVDAA